MPDLTDDELNAVVQTMIETHCRWLNRHAERWDQEYDDQWDQEGSEHRYSSSDFASITNEYGYRRVLATTLLPSRLVIHVEISDGDEGGPSILTGFHDEIDEAFYRNRLTGKVHGMSSDDLDWTKPTDLVYDHVEHRGWELKDLVVEFDTLRTHELADGSPINCPGDAQWEGNGKAPESTEDGDLVKGS